MFPLRGCRFRLTVTEVDTGAVRPVVQHLRPVDHSSVHVELTDEQVAEFGLPPGRYTFQGTDRSSSGGGPDNCRSSVCSPHEVAPGEEFTEDASPNC